MHSGAHKSGVRLNCLLISFLQVGSFKVRGDRNGQMGKGGGKKKESLSQETLHCHFALGPAI